MKLRDISETFETDLQDTEFVVGYLELALADGWPTFLIALKDVIQANGGVTKIAQTSDLGKDSLDTTLAESGNPQFETINKILGSLGLKLSIAICNDDSAMTPST